MKIRSVLVVAPHPLDEILGCGGAIYNHARDGALVNILILAGGDDERHRGLRSAAEDCASMLGAAPPSFCNFPENRTDTLPLGTLIGAVEAAVTEARPQRVYVSHGGNLNIDHQRAFDATVTACRPVPGAAVRDVLAYEILSSTDWATAAAGPLPFTPSIYIDIGECIEKKMAAIARYGGEMRDSPHARSPEAVQALAKLRGSTVGLPAAEAFTLVRRIEA